MKAKWWIIGGVILYALSKGAEMALAVKPGVLLSTTWQVQVIRDAVRRVWAEHGFTPTITSSMDGEHMDSSLHYQGLAEDYRTHDLPGNLKQTMFDAVQSLLGSDYQVIFEYENQANEHLHIEYDPKLS